MKHLLPVILLVACTPEIPFLDAAPAPARCTMAAPQMTIRGPGDVTETVVAPGPILGLRVDAVGFWTPYEAHVQIETPSGVPLLRVTPAGQGADEAVMGSSSQGGPVVLRLSGGRGFDPLIFRGLLVADPTIIVECPELTAPRERAARSPAS